jgi:hypothetical protein
MSATQLECLATMHENFLSRRLIQLHRWWHQIHSIGGINGTKDPGDGTCFVSFHQAILHQFEQYVRGSSGVPWRLPPWNPVRNLPPRLGIIPPRYQSLGTQVTNNPNYTQPGVFTPRGEYVGAEKVSFLDAPSLEIVGQLVGLHNHNGPHSGLPNVMPDSSISPIALAFFVWHQEIQLKLEMWLRGPAGIAWTAAHPNHSIFTQFDPAAYFSTAPFAGDLTCQGILPPPPICTLLQSYQALVDQAAAAATAATAIAEAVGTLFPSFG